jgi:hypothetical protein
VWRLDALHTHTMCVRMYKACGGRVMYRVYSACGALTPYIHTRYIMCKDALYAGIRMLVSVYTCLSQCKDACLSVWVVCLSLRMIIFTP